MKKNKLMFLMTSLACAVLFSATAKADILKIDPEASKVRWVGKKLTGQHNGTVDVQGGELHVMNNEILTGTITLNMQSITVLDSGGEKLTNHLKSDDFFGTDTFPSATFVILNTKSMPVKTNGFNTEINGLLTVKGITKPLSFPAKVTFEPTGVKASATNILVDRTLYNVRYGSSKFFPNIGDKVIYDKFSIDVDLVAGK